MIEECGKAVFYAKAEGEDAFQSDTHIGKQVPLSTTSAEKAILAELPDERIRDILNEHGLPEATEHTITSRENLMAEIEECRDRSFATDDEKPELYDAATDESAVLENVAVDDDDGTIHFNDPRHGGNACAAI